MKYLFGSLAVVAFFWMGAAAGQKDYIGTAIMGAWVLLLLGGVCLERWKERAS